MVCTKRTNKPYYNRTNTCDNIKEDGKKCGNKLKSNNAHREFDKKGNWTGKWLCNICYLKNDRLERFVSDRRKGVQDPNSSNAKGDLFEELTCKWRGVKRLSVERDNYTLPLDHTRDPELGIIQTKGAFYNATNRNWSLKTTTEYGKEFDYLIAYCATGDGNIIERIYIFPRYEVVKRSGICIIKYNYRMKLYKDGWYEKYIIRDENILKRINEIWKQIIETGE